MPARSQGPQRIRVLILGTGNMANTHAEAYAGIEGVDIVAAVDPDTAVLRPFCKRHGIEKHFRSLQQALSWGQFDAVSNVTPDAIHCQSSLAVLAAKKHLLCEKPLATDYRDASKMADAANTAGVVNMVNLVYRDVPALQQAATLVAQGEIGQLRHFEASYLQSWLTQPAWGDWRSEDSWLWRLSSAHGSHGVLGDVGIHILDFTSHAAGAMPGSIACRLKTFAKTDNNRIGEYLLDANDSFVMHCELRNGAVGTISASRFASGHLNDLRLRLYGDKGGLEILYEKKVSRLNLCSGQDLIDVHWQQVSTPTVASSYQRFVQAIRNGTQGEPDFAHGARLQLVLDKAMESDQAGRVLPVQE